MTIWRDTEYKCYASEAEGLTAVETDFFEGKCPEFIEGYIFVATGETWTREDGMTFYGEMITPWKPLGELLNAQMAYLEKELEDADRALEVLGVTYG